MLIWKGHQNVLLISEKSKQDLEQRRTVYMIGYLLLHNKARDIFVQMLAFSFKILEGWKKKIPVEIAIIRRLGEECKSSLGLSFYSVLNFEPSKSLRLIKLSTFKTHSGCSGASSCREKRREAGRPLGRQWSGSGRDRWFWNGAVEVVRSQVGRAETVGRADERVSPVREGKKKSRIIPHICLRQLEKRR